MHDYEILIWLGGGGGEVIMAELIDKSTLSYF